MSDASLYRCMTKGTDHASGPPTRGLHWVVSRRGRLAVYRDRVELGDWCIWHDAVRAATVYTFPSLLGHGHVLELSTDERTYQFGLNPWAKPWVHLPYRITHEHVGLGLSIGSIALRTVVVVILLVSARDAFRRGDHAWMAIDLLLAGALGLPVVAFAARRLRDALDGSGRGGR